MRREFLIILLLVLVTLTVYWQVSNHVFVEFDDTSYVARNRYVQAGLSSESIKWAFSITDISYWHPLTWLSLMLDNEFYGMNSRGYHLTNVVFHLLNTVLLFVVLRWITGSLWRSAFVAALFALHPLNVESVAWATERKSVLSTFFWMLTMLIYVYYTEHPSVYRYLLLALVFILGLMSKPMLVTLPGVLLLLDFWPLGRLQLSRLLGGSNEMMSTSSVPGFRRSLPYGLILEKAPLFFLSGISAYITSLSAQRIGVLISTESVPIKLRIANGLVSYVKYIGKMIWPQNLAVFYPYPSNVPIWQIVGAGLLLLGVSVLVFRSLRKLPYLSTGWLWYLGTLLPVIGLKQAGLWPAMADRFAYVPLIGLFIIVAWGIPDLLRTWRYRSTVLGCAAGAVLAALLLLTWSQLQHWKNTTALFEHTLNVTDSNWVAHTNFANALVEDGRIEEAIVHYTEALQVKPQSAKAHNNLGIAFFNLGKLEKAIGHYSRALQIEPDSAETHNNLGVALFTRGEANKAADHYFRALRLKPDYAEAHNNLGNSLAQQGKLIEAADFYSRALEIRPDYAEAHNNLGVALARQGHLNEAISHFREALRLKPDYMQARANLGIALLETGKSVEDPDRSLP